MDTVKVCGFWITFVRVQSEIRSFFVDVYVVLLKTLGSMGTVEYIHSTLWRHEECRHLDTTHHMGIFIHGWVRWISQLLGYGFVSLSSQASNNSSSKQNDKSLFTIRNWAKKKRRVFILLLSNFMSNRFFPTFLFVLLFFPLIFSSSILNPASFYTFFTPFEQNEILVFTKVKKMRILSIFAVYY